MRLCIRAASECEVCERPGQSTRSSEVCVQPEGVVRGAGHHAHPLVLAHALLKEVGLSLQRDVLHEVEGVLHPVELQRHGQILNPQRSKQPEQQETSEDPDPGLNLSWR